MDEAFYFGDAEGVFGVYHPPAQGFGSVAAVICPPLFNDYSRSHAALRSVAVSLAAAGQHVLRFDYRGTGDSHGDLEDVCLGDWVEDARAAVEEILEISGARTVRILTVRAGALIAYEALLASQLVDGFVLWDPASEGAAYVEELQNTQREFLDWDVEIGQEDRVDGLKDFGTYRPSVELVNELSALGDFGVGVGRACTFKAVLTGGARSPRQDWDDVSVLDLASGWSTLSEDLINPRPVLDELVRMMAAP